MGKPERENADAVVKRIFVITTVGAIVFAAIVFTSILPNW